MNIKKLKMEKNNINTEDNLMAQINSFKDQYYMDNTKNMFFKKSQKMECAKQISAKFDIKQMFDKTFFIIPNTNNIYIDYTVFKLFMNEDNYELSIDHVLSLIDICIEKYGNYSIHLNINSLTVSAMERYKKLLELYSEKCAILNKGYSFKINNFCIYYPPNAIEMIYKIIIHVFQENVKNKINVIPKIDSEKKINELFS